MDAEPPEDPIVESAAGPSREPRHLGSAAGPRRRTLTLVLLSLLVGGGIAVARVSAQGVPARPGPADGTSTSGPPSDTDASSTSAARGPLGSGETVTIAFVGDMNFEGSLRARLDAEPSTAVGPFAELLRTADLAVGNLETAIAVGGTRADKQFTFRTPPSATAALRAAGLDVVSMANNHGLDYGPEGLAESVAAARAQPDHLIIGIGAEENEAYAPFTATVKGQRISVIGATQVLDDNLISAWTATAGHGGLASAKRVDRLTAEVGKARLSSDTVIVFLHWGVEKSTCPTGDQQRLAAALARRRWSRLDHRESRPPAAGWRTLG